MKLLCIVFLVLCSTSVRSQIRLEHVYSNIGDNAGIYDDFSLVQVDSGLSKYVIFNAYDSISIFNLDHSLDRILRVPNPSRRSELLMIARRLFNLDEAYEYMLLEDPYRLRIYNEGGDLLFSCDACYGPHIHHGNNQNPPLFQSTENGTKMILANIDSSNAMVYSLPGKLPGTSAKLSVKHSTSVTTIASPRAFPNPSNTQVHIEYTLPFGVTNGELILTTESGLELKRYKITNAFNDLLIEEADLPTGAYFYNIVTPNGVSEASRILHIR